MLSTRIRRIETVACSWSEVILVPGVNAWGCKTMRVPTVTSAPVDGVLSAADGVLSAADGVLSAADGVLSAADGVLSAADGVLSAPLLPVEHPETRSASVLTTATAAAIRRFRLPTFGPYVARWET
jgi:hypothetical protein